MGQSDVDPRKIDLNLYGNLPIETLYQYAYVAQLERQLKHFLERVLHFDARLRTSNSKVFTEMTSREHQHIEKMNVSYLHNMKFTLIHWGPSSASD